MRALHISYYNFKGKKYNLQHLKKLELRLKKQFNINSRKQKIMEGLTFHLNSIRTKNTAKSNIAIKGKRKANRD
jgi:hypothetical protein